MSKSEKEFKLLLLFVEECEKHSHMLSEGINVIEIDKLKELAGVN